jgi:hypothetical protein
MSFNPQYNSVDPTLAEGQFSTGRVDQNGRLLVSASSGGSGGTADQVQGNSASGAADTGNPVKVGGVHGLSLPNLGPGERGDLQLDSTGGLYVSIKDQNGTNGADVSNAGTDALDPTSFAGLYGLSFGYVFNGTTMDRIRGNTTGLMVIPPSNSWNYAAATGGIVNTTTAVTIKTAAGSGIRNYLQSLQIDHDTLGGATEIAIRDGANGTVLWRGKLQTAEVEGAKISFNPPLKGSANTLLEVVTLTAVTGGVFVNAQGYMAP